MIIVTTVVCDKLPTHTDNNSRYKVSMVFYNFGNSVINEESTICYSELRGSSEITIMIEVANDTNIVSLWYGYTKVSNTNWYVQDSLDKWLAIKNMIGLDVGILKLKAYEMLLDIMNNNTRYYEQ